MSEMFHKSPMQRSLPFRSREYMSSDLPMSSVPILSRNLNVLQELVSGIFKAFDF